MWNILRYVAQRWYKLGKYERKEVYIEPIDAFIILVDFIKVVSYYNKGESVRFTVVTNLIKFYQEGHRFQTKTEYKVKCFGVNVQEYKCESVFCSRSSVRR